MKIIRLLSAILLGGTLVSSSHAITITEDFKSGGLGGTPFARGWSVVGDTNLFLWNSSAEHLEVTWDSSKPNSFFQHPLGMTLNKSHDFAAGFDLKLTSIGSHEAKPGGMQIAVGFINLKQATNITYYRATGFDSPNLAEFTYFRNTGWGASVSPVVISTNNQWALNFSDYLYEFLMNENYRIEMNYTATNQTLFTVVKWNGTNAFSVAVSLTSLDPNFSDFALDTIAISSYSDEGQDPEWAGSILAHGIIDNFSVTTPAPPVGRIAFQKNGSVSQAQVFCQPGETYILQRTTDFATWSDVSSGLAINNTITLQDIAPPGGSGFYRIIQQN